MTPGLSKGVVKLGLFLKVFFTKPKNLKSTNFRGFKAFLEKH